MASVKTYSAKNITLIFGGAKVHGFAEDDIVSIKPNGDGIQTYVGADGEVGRSLDPDETLEITVTLAQTSSSNDLFSTAYNLDRKTGKGMVPLIIKDLSGTTMVSASQCWVANTPEMKKGKNIESNEWTLHTGQATVFVGGND